MIQEDRIKIFHPIDNGRWVLVDYEIDVCAYDDRTNSADCYLLNYKIIDQELHEDYNWDDTSWVNDKVVKTAANLK